MRELKQRLSELLDRAEQGEIIRVTDRGRPKAVLGPLPGRHKLEQGIAEGWIAAGSRKRLDAAKRVRAEKRIADVLREDRGE